MVWLVGTLVFTLDLSIRNQTTPLFLIAIIGGISSLILAFIVASTFSIVPGIRRYLTSLIIPQGGYVYYLFALFFFPLFLYGGMLLTEAIGQPVEQYNHDYAGFSLFGIVILTFVKIFLFTGGVNEETGWRGFALLLLLKMYNPLIATLILWIVWVLWHTPIKLGPLATQEPWRVLYEWISLLPISILFTWLFIKTRGSILVCALLHTSMNVASEFIPITIGSDAIGITIVLIIIISNKMWRNGSMIEMKQILRQN